VPLPEAKADAALFSSLKRRVPSSLLFFEELKNEEPDRRGQIGELSIRIDAANQPRQAYASQFSNLTQGLPKVLFERDTRLLVLDYDRTLGDRRFHAPVLPMTGQRLSDSIMIMCGTRDTSAGKIALPACVQDNRV
jgi:hypothetical protein